MESLVSEGIILSLKTMEPCWPLSLSSQCQEQLLQSTWVSSSIEVELLVQIAEESSTMQLQLLDTDVRTAWTIGSSKTHGVFIGVIKVISRFKEAKTIQAFAEFKC
jgi:hypothetical protein